MEVDKKSFELLEIKLANYAQLTIVDNDNDTIVAHLYSDNKYDVRKAYAERIVKALNRTKKAEETINTLHEYIEEKDKYIKVLNDHILDQDELIADYDRKLKRALIGQLVLFIQVLVLGIYIIWKL